MRKLLSVFFVLFACESAARADWPMRRQNAQRTAMAPGVSDIDKPSLRWRYFLGGSIASNQYAAVDINGDGRREVVFVAGSRLIAKDAQRDTVLWETAIYDFSRIDHVADLDGNGSLEIVASNDDGLLVVLDARSGGLLWTMPAGFLGLVGAVRFADIDGDGLLDLYVTDSGCGRVGTNPESAAIYSFAPGAAQPLELCRLQTASRDYYCGRYDTLVDIDGDGRLEILAIGSSNLYLYSTVPEGGVCRLKYQLSIGMVGYGKAPVDFADTDGDGLPEVYLYSNNNYTAANNSRRVIMVEYNPASRALQKTWEFSVTDVENDRHQYHHDSLGDLNGDGRFEVVTSLYRATTGQWTLYVLNAVNGSVIASQANYYVSGIADLDGNGESEILVQKVNPSRLCAMDLVGGSLQELWCQSGITAANVYDPIQRLDRSANQRTFKMDVDKDGTPELMVRVSSTGLRAVDPLTGSERLTYSVPDGTVVQTWEPFPDVTRSGEQVLLGRSDGFLVVLGHQLEPTNQDEYQPGMRVGGYYTGYNAYGHVPVAADIDRDGVADVMVRDSRGVLLWLKPSADSSWIRPPASPWNIAGGFYPVLLQWDRDAELELALARGSRIEVLDFNGSFSPVTLWSTNVSPYSIYLDPLPLDADGDGQLDLFITMSSASGGYGLHNVLRHRDGARLWAADFQQVVAGASFQSAAVVDLDNQAGEDVATGMKGRLYLLRGSSGAQLADLVYYHATPLVADVDSDGYREILPSGPYLKLYAYRVNHLQAQATQTWLENDAQAGYRFLAALAPCPDGVRLINARLRSGQILWRNAAAGQILAQPVFAGGKQYSSEEEALAAGDRPGFAGNISVHLSLAGAGPVAVFGSSDGYLYAADACSGNLLWSYNFRYPVGEPIFADTDGDGRDEIIVSVADGYLYGLDREVLPAPAAVYDRDCASPAAGGDIDETQNQATLCARWEPVAGATSYLYTIVTANGVSILGGEQGEWRVAESPAKVVGGLPLKSGRRYFFVVMARAGNQTSVQTVSDGVWVVCPQGRADCNDDLQLDGCETDMASDANCGACGQVCPAPQFCFQGACVADCPAPLERCQGLCIDTGSDPRNCGGCGSVCAAPGAVTACENGTCVIAGCEAGRADCDGLYANGCETALDTLENCGGCGNVCRLPQAEAQCRDGLCLIGACLPGFLNCNADPADGCEVDSRTNPQNCGACRLRCWNEHGVAECREGVCQPVCDTLWGDCDGNPANGCETRLDSLAHCGKCGRACELSHAGESCVDGVCLITTCDDGYADCNGKAADGCEVLLGWDAANCGACGRACVNGHGTTSCQQGVCVPVCAEGYGDCDGEVTNGCEASLASRQHCGVCGRVCSGEEQCVGGECRADCPDADGDGFAASNCGGADCDDTNRDFHPQAQEVCDGRDNDCDGQTDEGLDCRPDINGGCGCSSSKNGGAEGLPASALLLFVLRRRKTSRGLSAGRGAADREGSHA